MSSPNLSDKLTEYLRDELVKNRIDNSIIILCRQDGIPIYSYNKNSSMDDNSLGALIGGMWQAAEALMKHYVSSEDVSKEFRLSFDTSSSGIYLLPVHVLGEKMYLGIIYEDEVNPGFLKTRARSLIGKMEEYFINFKKMNNKESKNQYLFRNITDDEIDNMFDF